MCLPSCPAESTNGCPAWRARVWWVRMPSSPAWVRRLEIFSRYERVEKASGDQVTLKEYLEYVWAAVAREALTMIFEGADASGLEEDARLTAMWLWTLSTADSGGTADQSIEDDAEDEEDSTSSGGKVTAGYFLEFDAARKIAQGLGAHLERLASLVEVKGDKARLVPVAERARHLFGKDEGQAPARRQPKPAQLSLLATLDEADQEAGGWGEKSVPELGITVLDRVHQTMILFAAGRSEALKRFLVEEKAGNDQRFWHLAQALSALYPAGSDEKRWVRRSAGEKERVGVLMGGPIHRIDRISGIHRMFLAILSIPPILFWLKAGDDDSPG